MSTRKERAERRRQLVRNSTGRLVRPCPNCHEAGPHFVPPSFGDDGFFICKPKVSQ